MQFPKRHRRKWIACLAILLASIGVGIYLNLSKTLPSNSLPSEPHVANPFLPLGVEDLGWPQVRGPKFDGHSPEIHLANSWPAEGPPVLWVRSLGQGYSSFATKGNRIYTQYQTLSGQYVACLNAQTGETVWTYRYDWPYEYSGLYPGPRSTPTLAEDCIVFTGPDGKVGCLNEQGKVTWEFNLFERFQNDPPGFGYSISPTILDGIVYLPVGGKGASMVALDLKSGKTIWKTGEESASYTPALPISINGKDIILGYLEHDLVAYSMPDGKELWKKKLSHGYDEHAAWPIYREPHLWISGPFQSGSELLKLSYQESASFESVWKTSILSNDVASSVEVDGYLYGFDLSDIQSKAHRPSRGTFRCIKFLTGEERWSNGSPRVRRKLDANDSDTERVVGHASVIVADGKVYLFNDLGELILARATPEKYDELGRAKVLGGEIVWTSPALNRGCLYIRNHTHAACIYVGEPGLLTQAQASTATSIEALPQKSFNDWTFLLGVEPEYAMDVPTYAQLVKWFYYSLGLIIVSGALCLVVWFPLRKKMNSKQWSPIFWVLLFLLGATCTAPLSLHFGEFIFTWPVALFAAFGMTFEVLDKNRKQYQRRYLLKQSDWGAILFLLICVTYIVLCRQLSLATELVFLAGCVGAMAVMFLSNKLTGRLPCPMAWQLISIPLAWLGFYAASIALLAAKYTIYDS